MKKEFSNEQIKEWLKNEGVISPDGTWNTENAFELLKFYKQLTNDVIGLEEDDEWYEVDLEDLEVDDDFFDEEDDEEGLFDYKKESDEDLDF